MKFKLDISEEMKIRLRADIDQEYELEANSGDVSMLRLVCLQYTTEDLDCELDTQEALVLGDIIVKKIAKLDNETQEELIAEYTGIRQQIDDIQEARLELIEVEA